MNPSKLKLCRAAFGVAALFGLFLLAGVGQAATYYFNGQQAGGENWNQSIWTNVAGGTKLPPVAGSSYVVLTYPSGGANPARTRNPTTGGQIQTFAGDSMQLNSLAEIRAKQQDVAPKPSTLNFPGVNGNPGLILNGGNVDVGDDFLCGLTGVVLVQAPSSISCGDAVQIPRGWSVPAQIRGSSGLTIMKRVSRTVGNFVASVDLTCTTNTFSGPWLVQGGLLRGTGLNSLGTNSITVTNHSGNSTNFGSIEPMYDLACSGRLTLYNTCQLVLHQNCSFSAGVTIAGSNLPAGVYPAATLTAAFPNNFPAGSGQITVGTPPVITVQMTNLTVMQGSAATFAVVASSLGSLTYFWYTNGPATNVVLDPNATTNSYTLPAVAMDDNGKTFQVVVSNVLGTTTSTVATLTVVDPTVHIYAPPVNLVGNENSTVMFTVGAIGAGTLDYQWYSNGVAILNETNSFYTTPLLKPVPFNTVAYSVSVSNSVPSIMTSTPVYVTVTPEAIPPHLTAAIARGGPTNAITVWFDEPVVPNPANYTIPGINVLSAASGQNSNSVVLTTAPLTPGSTYPLTVSGVNDQDAQAPNASTAVTTNLVYQGTFSPGFALAEVYNNIGAGTTIADLTNSAKYLQGQPDVTTYLTNVYFNNGGGTNYGAKVSGYFTAPVSGDYGFYLIHDDPGQFRLSSDDNPANLNQAVPLINQGCCNGAYADGANAATNTLVAGQRYYFELLMKQGGGGEYVGLAIRFPGDARATASLPSFFGLPFVGSYANPNNASLAYLNQPQDVFTYQNQAATITALITFAPTGPVEYQWLGDDGLYNFTNIVGGTGITYATNSSGVAISFVTYTTPVLGAQTNHFQLLVSIPGSGPVASRIITVYAATDNNPPQVVSVAQGNTPANTAPTVVNVTFSEPVDPVTAANPAHYAVNGVPGSVLTVVPTAANSVQLVATGLVVGVTNSLFVTSVGDTAGNLVADTTAAFRGYAMVSNGMARCLWFTNMGSAGNVSWVNTLLAWPNFTNNQPDLVTYTNFLYYNGNNGNNGVASNYYGQFWTGYLTPPISGNYSFWVQADDEGRFLLSTDENPANLQLVVRYADGACCGNGIYESGTVYLQAGRSYFYEGLMKQGTGGDYFRIQWQMPGNGAYSIIPSSCLSFKVWPPDMVAITAMPTNVTVLESNALTLSVGAVSFSEPGVNYQWLANGVTIGGATNPSYTVAAVTTNLNGVAFRCAVTGRAVNTTNYYGGTYANTLYTTDAVVTVNWLLRPPSVITAAGSGNSITVNWDGASGQTNYVVNRAPSSGGPYAVVGATTGTTFVDSSLPSGFVGYYFVTVQGPIGSTNSVEVSAATIPSAPVLQASSRDSAVGLAWTPILGVAQYYVMVSTTHGGPYTLLGASAANSFTHAPLVNGSTTYYVVYGSNAAGVGPYSNEAIGTPKLGPTGLTAIPGTALVALNWNVFSGAASYNVKRSATHGGPYAVVGSGVTSLNTVDSPVAPGWFYYYVVSAQLAGNQESGDSAEASALVFPGAPTTLAAVLVSSNSIRLSWTSANDPSLTTFKVERAIDGVTFTQIAAGLSGTNYADSAPPLAMMTYYYRVRASNATGDSPYSSVASAMSASFAVDINFQSTNNSGGGSITPAALWYPGYLIDIGDPYGLRTNGYTYGWSDAEYANARYRQSANSPDIRYDTLAQPQKNTPNANWSIRVPNGVYLVHITSGDPSNFDNEGWVVNGVSTPFWTQDGINHWHEFSNIVCYVTNSVLVVTNGPGVSNAKICYINIASVPWMPQFIAQPQSTNIFGGQTAALALTVPGPGTPPLTYQWYFNGSVVPSQTNLSLILSNALPSVAGSYALVATDPFGNTEASSNAVVNVETPPAVLTAAGAVSSIALDWSQAAGVFNLVVNRATASGGPYTPIAVLPPGATNYLDAPLPAGFAGYYVITAQGPAGTTNSPEATAATIPSAPVLRASSGDSTVTLGWQPVPGVEQYFLLVSSTHGGPYTLLAATPANSFVHAPLVNWTTTNYYVVYGTNAVGVGPYSNEAIGTPRPGPVGLVAVGRIGQAALSWSPFPDAVSYAVKRSATHGGPYAVVQPGVTGTNTVDSPLTAGLFYYYVVSARVAGGQESGDSPEASALTAPSAPAGLTAALVGTIAVNLNWSSANDPSVTTFKVERSTDGVTFAPIATGVSGTSFVDSNTITLVTFYYRVRASNATADSPPSNVASATTGSFAANINFGLLSASDFYPGYLQDSGYVYGDRTNGYTYGWTKDVTADARERLSALSADKRYDTLIHFMKAAPYAAWSIAVPNGAYRVHFASGDATAYDMVVQFDVNGLLTDTFNMNATGNPYGHWMEFSNLVISVTNNLVTVTNGPAASNNKICYIDIQSVPPPPLVIVAQPQSTNILELQTAIFTVAATGAQPFSYQWYYGDLPLAGQTSSTMTLPDVPLSGAGLYHVVVTDPFGITATSSNALLTVGVDNIQPTLASAAGHFTHTLATVTFSERVTEESGTNLVNYQINDGNGDVLPIFNAVLQPNRATVLLTTAPQTPGMVYTVTVSDVADISSRHNVIPIYSAVDFTGWVESPGYLYVQRFDNIPDVNVSNLTSTAKFMTEAADATGFVTNFNFTTGGLANYGARISGYFIAPSNGVYRFYIRSDDASQLFLNPNGPDPMGKMWIASEEGCCHAYDPTVGSGTPLTFNSNSVSAGFPLTSGMRYYIEALLKQGTGGEYVQVAFREAGDYSVPVSPNSSTTVGAEVAGSQFFSTPANPDVIGAAITQQPQDVTVEENRTAVFRFGAAVMPTNMQTFARYQWLKDGVIIPGANSTTLTGPEVVLVGNQYLPMAPLYDDGASYQCVLTAPGLSVTSSPAMLHVWPDYEGPNVVSVGSLDGRQIGVVFDEVVDPISATDPGNWTINNYAVGVVGSPVLRPDGKTVLLTLDTQVSSGYAVEALVYDIASDGGNFGDSFANGVVLMPASGHQDIGVAPGLADPLYPGSVFVGSSSNLIEVFAGGTDIWSTNDGLHYIFVPLAGDFTAQVRVQSLTAANLWTKAGLMLRETLNPNSRELAILATPSTADGGTNVFQVTWRDPANSGASAPARTVPNVYSYPDAWLRLARRGTNFYTYYGTNGLDWIMLYSNAPSPAYGDTAFIGLGTTAHNNGPTNYTIADFADFQILAPPIITRQPEPASVMVPVYGQTRFTNLVVDSSSAVTYQWRKDGVPIVASVNPYATNASLRLFNLLPADAGNYTVAIINENGTTISAPCVVSVSNAPPVVVAETNSVLQNVVLQIPASDLLRNDSDPEGGTLSVSALGGLSTRVFATDFQAGLPANTAIYGSAAVVAAGANQYLQLTPASGLQYGSWIINEVPPGVAVNSFSVVFRVRIADTSQVPESGFSLNFATDLVDAAAPAFPALAEYGVGSGLSVCVKTYDYNGANTAGIMVKWNGTTVGGVQIPQWLNTNWVPMQIDLGQNGKVNVALNGTNVFRGLPTPYVAFTGGRFGFYARTGGQWETHSFDDLSIYIPSVSDSNRTTTALGGTAVLSNNVVTYTPATGVCGWDSFNYVVSDGMGGLSASTKWVRISPANPQPPFFVFCPNFSVPVTPTNCQVALPDYTSSLVVTDSCCCLTLLQSPPAGTMVGAGVHSIVFTATDAIGLSSSCTTIVTVQETLPPSFVSCPSAMTVPNDPGQCGAVVHYTNPVGVDAWICPGVASPVTVQIAGLPSGAVYPVGKTTNTFRATSAVGISSLCRFVVTVTDSENPHVTCAPAQTLTAGAGGTAALPDLTAATVATDNCGTPSLQQAPAAGTQLPVGANNVVITARDGAGNINTCTVVVTVQSGVKPEPAIAVLDTGEVKVSWPATATGWSLYSTPEMKDAATVWTKVSASLYQTNNGVIYILVTDPAGQPNTFYRLKNP